MSRNRPYWRACLRNIPVTSGSVDILHHFQADVPLCVRLSTRPANSSGDPHRYDRSVTRYWTSVVAFQSTSKGTPLTTDRLEQPQIRKLKYIFSSLVRTAYARQSAASKRLALFLCVSYFSLFLKNIFLCLVVSWAVRNTHSLTFFFYFCMFSRIFRENSDQCFCPLGCGGARYASKIVSRE